MKSGKVRLEYRDYLIFGATSGKIAEAAACAADQGVFWQYHDTLFTNQGLKNQGIFGVPGLERIAELMGLDQAAFTACLDSGQHAGTVAADVKAGAAAGVGSTPTIFVNGVQVDGFSYEAVKAAIETALATGNPA